MSVTLQPLMDFANDVSDFMHNGIFGFFIKLFSKLVVWIALAIIKFKIIVITFAWTVAQSIMDELKLSEHLTQAWAALDSKTLSLITYLRIPEAINILLSAKLTRFIINFLGL